MQHEKESERTNSWTKIPVKTLNKTGDDKKDARIKKD